MIILSQEMKRTLTKAKRLHGRVSSAYVQYKFHFTYKDAEKIVKEFYGKRIRNKC